MSKQRICIVIPAYNEEKRIGKTLEKYGKFFQKVESQVNPRILVVLNACKDKTIEVVKSFKKQFPNIDYLDFEQGGKGFAICKGFEYAIKHKFDLVGYLDADGSTPPAAFYYLILNLGNAQGCIANRWSKKSRIPQKQSIKRRIMSRVFNFIVRGLLFLPFQDTQCGAKLFRTQPIEEILEKIGASEWGFDVNLLYLLSKNKNKILELPTIWADDKNSKVNSVKTSFQMFLSVVRLRLVYSPIERTRKILRPIVKILYYLSK